MTLKTLPIAMLLELFGLGSERVKSVEVDELLRYLCIVSLGLLVYRRAPYVSEAPPLAEW